MKNNVLNWVVGAIMLSGMLFAAFAAADSDPMPGIGEVTYLSIDGFESDIDDGVMSVDEEKEIIFRLHNDGPETYCIDEIIISFPDTWQGKIDTGYVHVTNMGDVIITNEKDDGTYSGLVSDDVSIRIIPDNTGDTSDGVMLCPSGTTQITIKDGSGLVSPQDPELSEIMFMTSDQYSNEPTSSYVRQPIDVLPIIQITDAVTVEIQYMDIESIASGAGGADYKMVAVAKGGWARLDELYLSSSFNTEIDVYMDRNGDGVLQTGTDFLLAEDVPVYPATTTVKLDGYSGVDITGLVDEGYLVDWEQDVSAEVAFFIELNNGASLELLGHADSDADGSIDPTYKGTGYSNPPKEGTVINVEDMMKRNIHVQLVRKDVEKRSLYVHESGVPIYYTTTMSNFEYDSPRQTDADGQVEIYLMPGTTAGNAYVTVTFPDVADVYEDVAIAPGEPYSFEITHGLDTSVVAGESEIIEVTIYDQYGNVISNNPDRPTVSFEILDAPDSDADLDDDTSPPFVGDGDGYESENSNMGIGDAELLTSETVGEHVVEVCVDNPDLGCKQTTITGTLGQAHAMDCILSKSPIVKADECFDVLVHVVDEKGNPLLKWESIVEISLQDTNKYIQSTDLREPVYSNNGRTVTGKLNNDDPAYATVTVCGCDYLGLLEVVCRSDTLLDDEETLDVVNSDADCIDIDTISIGSCDYSGQLQASILDTCGNYLIDQECAPGAWASSCVMLEASCGVLSTEKTCVDLYNTGKAPIVDIDISGCPCGNVAVTATDEDDCCASVYDGPLPMCHSTVINKIGPYGYLDWEVYPEPYNLRPDQFYVSERTVVDLTMYDDCGQVYTCSGNSIDLELEGEDCVMTDIKVDNPLELGTSGKCYGFVPCSELTPFGEEKCEETPECSFVEDGGYCTGTPDCTAMMWQQQCTNWGCVWNNGECAGDPDFECEDPTSPGAGTNKEVCGEVGCIWTPEYECVGEAVKESCQYYNYEQCELIGEFAESSCNWVGDTCRFEDEAIYKFVVENCAEATKHDVPGKEWTDIPEKDDIIVDKVAFLYNGPSTSVEACIYEESEETAGFQAYEDYQWACGELNKLRTVPGSDGTNYPHYGAWDSIHDGDGLRDAYDDVYLLELKDRISEWYLGEYDNQRMGGALIEPGDTKDFYIVITSLGNIPCGTYDVDYLYFQDYNSPDWIEWDNGGHVRDTIEGSERYTRRNANYDGYDSGPGDTVPDPYPEYYMTSDYGFGDRVLHNLGFIKGKARAIFRDLVAETVRIMANGNEKSVTFSPQPATQVVAINHGDVRAHEGNPDVCTGDDYLSMPYPNFAEDTDCVPAMACSDEGYDINLQVTDGFQNQVGLEGIKIQLEACLMYPRIVHIKDDLDREVEVDLWERMHIGGSEDPRDVCFDLDEYRAEMKDILNEHLGTSDYYATMFLDDTEFSHLIDEIFEEKDVIFLNSDGTPVALDGYGHPAVYTDEDGRVMIRVESDDSSLFNMRSFDTRFRIFVVPYALDADYLDVEFQPGEPYAYDIMAWPEKGIPADGEQESMLLIRKLDQCGNPVAVYGEQVTVEVNGSAIISRDFSGNNNYDQDVTGTFQGCQMFWPWLEDCSLTVLDTVPEKVRVKVSDESEDCGPGLCVPIFSGDTHCEGIQDIDSCLDIGDCRWEPSMGICNQPDTAYIEFGGAPRQLKITGIRHSDMLPADGFMWHVNEPGPGACDYETLRRCHLYSYPEACFQSCKQYGGSGAWVTVEVQDKYGDRVYSYLGDGFQGDPGDAYGNPDYVFENICVALDDERAFIDDYAFGWVGLHQVTPHFYRPKVYCGDLAYGAGSVHVSYLMLDKHGQPLDPRETASVVVSVFDMCDSDHFARLGMPMPEDWDDECNGQEYDENNLPDSETASRLTPDYGQLDYVAVPDRWDISADKYVVAADGKDYAVITINPENEYFDVRASMEATVQSSLLGTELESEYILPECYVEGLKDPLNPTSIVVNTEDCSGGQARLRISSTEPGITRVTVTGNGYGCKEWVDALEYTHWFEKVFGEQEMCEMDMEVWEEHCVEDWTEICLDLNFGMMDMDYCMGEAEEICHGMMMSYHHYWSMYEEFAFGYSETELSHLYTPICTDWGIIPLTPKSIEIGFSQAFNDEIVLEEGWNYFSIPQELDPAADSWEELGLNSVCDASAMFDEASQSFVAPIPVSAVLEPMEGYWCYASSGMSLMVTPKVMNGVYLPPTKHIYTGWNDVGLTSTVEMKIEHALISIDSIYKMVLDWIETLQRYASYANTGEPGGGTTPGTTGAGNMQAGQAYLLWATDDDELASQS